MDLISREAAIDAISAWAEQPVISKSRGFEPKGKAIVLDMIGVVTEQPSVPAVPLDKLCEWLSENSIIVPCKFCQNFINDYCAAIKDTSIPCPKTADDWRWAITKWMEEQDAQKEN